MITLLQRLLLVLLIATVTVPLSAQTDDDKLKDMPDPSTLDAKKSLALGDKLFERGGIEKSLQYYQRAYQLDSTKTFINRKLADGFFSVRDYAGAAPYYQKLFRSGAAEADLTALYQYALTEKYLGHYQQSVILFQKLIKQSGSERGGEYIAAAATREIEGCELGTSFNQGRQFHNYSVSLLDSNINQPLTDFAPVMYDNNTLYVGKWVNDDVVLENRREKYATLSRIYSAKRTPAGWSAATPVRGTVNEVKFHTGNTAFTADKKSMYYTQCYQDDYMRMYCIIYKSSLVDGAWTEGEKLSNGVNVEGTTSTQPAIGKAEDGSSVLYFVSNREPEKGTDLYYAKINPDGTIGKPKNVGAPVNTTGNEMTPFFDAESNTLYFSSDGHVSIGGLDVFSCKPEGGKWQKPANLGVPVNSSVDDMYFNLVVGTDDGFLVSNRPGGFGAKSGTCCDDVYTVRRRYLRFAAAGKVTVEGENSAGQSIALIDAETGKTLQTVKADSKGFFFNLEPGKQYKVSAVRDGYFAAVQTINTKDKIESDTVTFTLSLKKMEKDKAYTLDNIYYDFNKATLTPASKAVLDTLYNVLVENPDIIIELSAHTDSKGSDKYNLELSQKRAESCMNYLVKEKKISAKRIRAKGYGETMPVAPNENPDGSDNEAGRAKNRRTEFKIVGGV